MLLNIQTQVRSYQFDLFLRHIHVMYADFNQWFHQRTNQEENCTIFSGQKARRELSSNKLSLNRTTDSHQIRYVNFKIYLNFVFDSMKQFGAVFLSQWRQHRSKFEFKTYVSLVTCMKCMYWFHSKLIEESRKILTSKLGHCIANYWF